MHQVLSSIERIKLLQGIIYKKGRLNVSDISRKLKLSKGLVSKYFMLLKKENITKSGQINHSHPKTKALKLFFNLQIIPQRIFKKYPETLSAGIYGSAAKGEDTEESDLDIYVFVDKNNNLPSLGQELMKICPKAKPLFLTKDKFNLIKKENPLFYHSLTFSSITIYGEKIENL